MIEIMIRQIFCLFFRIMDFDNSINTPAPEGPNNQSYFENPWAVEDGLEHFLNYNCPECEMKSASREVFLQHAINQHPLVKECLHLLTGIKDESLKSHQF